MPSVAVPIATRKAVIQISWFKVDDKLHDHHKANAAKKAAMGVWVLAGSWSADNLTDGFIPARVLANLGGETGEKAIGAYKEGICMMKYNEIAIRDMSGATWRDVVAAVLESCPEAFPLSYMYEKIELHSKAQKNKWWKEKIRQTLQCYPKHFSHDGRGLWSLCRKTA